MKHKTTKILLLFIAFFYQCNTSKIVFQKNPDFKILEVYEQGFVGGQPGNAGTNLIIQVSDYKNIIPDSLYFQNRVSKIDIKPNGKETLWVGRFQRITRKEVNLNQNSNEDVTVEIPEMENFPFELENNEAVLLYHQNNTAYYYKIKDITSKETIYYPSARPQN